MAFFAFTEITDPGAHVLYNEFHQLDHMPENFALPGVAYGQRWVSPPAYKAARIVSGDLLDPIHYVTHYLFTHPMAETMRDFVDLGRRMGAIGGKRFPAIRRNHITAPHMVVNTYVSPRVRLSPDALPYRPNRGVFLVVTRVTDDAAVDDVTQWYDQVHIPDMLTLDGVAGAWWFKSPAMVREGAGSLDLSRYADQVDKHRMIFLYYLDEDPLAVTEAIREKSSEWRASRWLPALDTCVEPLFAGPLQTVKPWDWGWFDKDR